MGNAERKRIAAAQHNMLRLEVEAYAEDRARFPKKHVDTRISSGSGRVTKLAMTYAISGIALSAQYERKH